MNINMILSKEFNLKKYQVENTIRLIDEGNTIPFIARYRKEETGDLSDSILRDFYDRLAYVRNLKSRKEEVIRLIDEQGKLSEDLVKEIEAATSLQRVEDLYRPYRPKRRTRATIAKEKGLERLANIISSQLKTIEELNHLSLEFVDEDKEVNSIDDALNGAMDIIAENISDDSEIRDLVRRYVLDKGLVESKGQVEEQSVYEMYYDYKEPVKSIANHRVLALNRGEKEKFLKVKIILDDEEILKSINKKIIHKDIDSKTYLIRTIEDSYSRLIFPSIEREVRNTLRERAEEDAIKVFSLNLKPLLMQAPFKGKVVMGIDPGFRTGCKVALVDDTGKVLDFTTVYPTEPQKRIQKTKDILGQMINKYGVNIIAIGNGTGSRETEMVIAELIRDFTKEIYYIIVNEAGASIYSASKIGEKEFPNLDVTIRGAVSIARRLQDPLSELVKIEPKHIGVGQYQHDLNQSNLDKALEGVVEDCVNTVGVDLNTASPSLLKYVAGISTRVATNILDFRSEKGRFTNRNQLKKVKGLGEKTFTQCAGFLRIVEGDNPFDNTGVHPESYDIAEKLVTMDYKNVDRKDLAKELNIGELTLKDIIKELEKPGRDPREDMPKPILRADVLTIDDLKTDIILKGTVRKVVDFGVFVDIGVKEDGLIHISKLSNAYIKHPKEIVKVGDVIDVRIIGIDKDRGRISLSMKDI